MRFRKDGIEYTRPDDQAAAPAPARPRMEISGPHARRYVCLGTRVRVRMESGSSLVRRALRWPPRPI